MDGRADTHFGKMCGCRKKGTDNLYVHNSRGEGAARDAEGHSKAARDAEKVLHLACIDDPPYRQEHPMVQMKTMLSVAYLVGVEGLLASRKNAQEAAKVFDEGGYLEKRQCSLAGMTVGDESQTAEKPCDSFAVHVVVAEGTVRRSQLTQTVMAASERLMAAHEVYTPVVEPESVTPQL